jgi:CheY-like chemotaxis protein
MNRKIETARKIEILLIEDNVADVDLFNLAMSGEYTITIAPTGAEALDRLFQRGRFEKIARPDIVVLDLSLPILSGHEVINVMKSNSSLRSIPIVVLSASSRSEDVRRAYDLGASAYIVKHTALIEAEKTLSAFADFWINHVIYSPAAVAKGLSPGLS